MKLTETKVIEALSALAQETRLRAFRLLVEAGEDGLPAGEIATSLDTSPATLSHHLTLLANAGLVESRRESRSIIYSLRPGGIKSLLTFLTKDCCKGKEELCGADLIAICSPARNIRKSARRA